MSDAIFGLARPAAIALVVAAAACADTDGRGPPALTSIEADELLPCPDRAVASASSVIGVLGGVVGVDGHEIVVPAGALAGPTEVTVQVPPSHYLEVEITAGEEGHIVFAEPAVITLSYGGCPVPETPLRGAYIDGETDRILEDMGGVDDRLTRTVTFPTGHLSSYAIAQ